MIETCVSIDLRAIQARETRNGNAERRDFSREEAVRPMTTVSRGCRAARARFVGRGMVALGEGGLALLRKSLQRWTMPGRCLGTARGAPEGEWS